LRSVFIATSLRAPSWHNTTRQPGVLLR